MAACSASANRMGALREYTDLKPATCVVTRWSSTYKMIQRFNELLPVFDLLPNQVDKLRLTQLQQDLYIFQQCSLNLQRADATCLDARDLFE